MKKRIVVLGLLVLSVLSYGQDNPFLDRTYWRTNPSIQDITQKITEGHDISALNGSMFDAVSWALIEKTDNETIKYLLTKKGNEVNKLTHDGRTYIFWAAYKDNLEIMKYLVNNGAKMDHIDSHGYSVINFAAATGQLNEKLYDFCIAKGGKVTDTNNNGANALLLVAPFIKDFSLIEYFTSKGIDIKSTDNNGNGMFNYAAKTGNIKLLNFLIEKGLPYKNLSKDGSNAMVFASRGTRSVTNGLEVYQFLEKLGVEPNIVTKSGATPLHSISYRGKDADIFNYFISKGIDINQPDENGNTPFLNASLLNSLEIVKLLSNKITDFNQKDKDGRTALTNAIRRNSIEVVKFLVDSGSDINILDKKGNNLMYYVMSSYNPKKFEEFTCKVDYLTEKGLQITQIQNNGNSLFHLALDKKDIKLLGWVKKHEVDINLKNKDGLTALHQVAMTAKDDKMLKYLLSIGADKNIKTDFEESVYELASENELLQKNKIDIQFLK